MKFPILTDPRETIFSFCTAVEGQKISNGSNPFISWSELWGGVDVINLFGMIDRALLSIGGLLVIAKILGWVPWAWKWVLAPLLAFVVVSFIKGQLIRKKAGL